MLRPYPFTALVRCPVEMTNSEEDSVEHAAVAARLHAALTSPTLDPAVRERHLQAVRRRATGLPAPVAPVAVPLASAPRRRTGRRFVAVLAAAGLALVMGATGAVAASGDALPGELLYPVKITSEQVLLALPTGRSVELHVSFARRRLDEAATLTDRGSDPTLVAEAIAAHTRLLSRADQLAATDVIDAARVDDATMVASRRLARLLEQNLPAVAAEQARAALSAARERLDGPGTTAGPDASGNPDRVPGAPGRPDPADRPGPPEDRGLPEDRGPPVEPGPRGEPGPPASAPGPPAVVPGPQAGTDGQHSDAAPSAPDPPRQAPPQAPAQGGPATGAEPPAAP